MAGTVVAVENTDAAVADGVALEVAAGVIGGPPIDPIRGCIAGAGADATVVGVATHSFEVGSHVNPASQAATLKSKVAGKSILKDSSVCTPPSVLNLL